MSGIAILFIIGFLITGINIYWNNRLFAEKIKLEAKERMMIKQATEKTLAKEKMLEFLREFENNWLIPYSSEPDKQFIGLGKLKSNIIIWFADQKEKENG